MMGVMAGLILGDDQLELAYSADYYHWRVLSPL